MALSVNAQQGAFVNPNGLALDSLSNTTAEGPTAQIKGTIKSISVTLELETLTGTVAGKVYLHGASRSGKYGVNPIDSLTLQAGTNNYQFMRVDPGWQFLQLYVVPTGTQLTRYSAYYYIRQ